MLPEGQQISHYRIVRFLKSGGMGEVYLAEDVLLRRQVAIKVIHTDSHRYAEAEAIKEATRLFLREAQAIAQLEQINILPVYDSGEVYVSETALMYMVMPYRREGSLKDWLRTHLGQELLPLLAVDRIVRQAAFALQHAHDHQIIHQDVKPANFLVYNETGDPAHLNLQLTDFGVAKFMMKTSESQVIRGTPAYMAPEQWECDPIPATDQYALAVMAYELLTGHLPFEGNGYHKLWYQHHHVAPKPPSMVNPKLPKDLDGVLLRALAKKAEDRYNSVSAFAKAFTRALQNSGDIHQTLTISMLEARTGTNRVLTLPSGRRVTVTIPAGAYQGQSIRMEGYGRPTTFDGPMGALIVTIAVAAAKEGVSPTDATLQQRAPTSVVKEDDFKPMSPRLSPGKRQARSGAKLITAFVLVFLVGSLSLIYVIKSHAGSVVNPTPTTTTSSCGIQGYPKYLAGCGTLLDINDTLGGDSKGHSWINTNPPDICMFKDSALHVSVKGASPNGTFHTCGPDSPHNFKNFAYQIKMTFIEGDCGGMTFRINGANLFYFYICQDGRYGLVHYLSNSDPSITLKKESNPNPYILAGSGQPYIIAVVVQDSNTILYVNQHQIDSDNDICYTNGSTIRVPCYNDGAIGVLAVSMNLNTRTEVAFNDANVWTF